MHPRDKIGWLACAALAIGVTTSGAQTAASVCEAGKQKAAGKYAECRLIAEAKFALVPDLAKLTADLARCGAKQSKTWSQLEARAVQQGGACPSVGDQDAVQDLLGSDTVVVATSLYGKPPLGGFIGVMLRTGATHCFEDALTAIPCPSTAQDGELRKGLTRGYVDNGDGTITDKKTTLTWEKMSDDDSIHDADITYSWTAAFGKIATLNATAFAGHTDWRLPNIIELQSLMDYGVAYPTISAPFNTGCVPGCSVLTCSCLHNDFYWSSSTHAWNHGDAWGGWFQNGVTTRQSKTNPMIVRAVRGGL
jgi:hypothetical protein